MDSHSHTPMPSRPSLPPPPPPKNAKPVQLKTISAGVISGSKKHRARRWLIVSLIIVLLLLGVITALIAKTGVYTIPVFSSLYHARAVTRLVDAVPVEPRDLLASVNERLRRATSTKSGDVTVSVSEKEMTGALKGAFESALKRPGVFIDRSQIAATPSGLEVAASVRNETMSVHLIAMIVPRLEGGKVAFDAKEVYLGDLRVPASSLAQIERIAFGTELGSFEAAAGAYRLKDIVLKEGSVDLLFSTSTKSTF